MKESDIVKKIRDWLAQEGCLSFKMHGSIYMYKGFSDVFGLFPDGRAFFLEVKKPGKKPEPHQEAFLRLCASYGAVTGWCDSLLGAKKVLAAHISASKR